MSRQLSYKRAINEALLQEMKRDPSTILYGEDVSRLGGVFRVTKGLADAIGADRVFDTPISEATLVGMAVGAAITGLRPICELQFSDFSAIAMDEIYNKLAKWRYMHGGNFRMPVVLRLPMGASGGAGAEHSQSLESLFMNCPGLYIAVPSTPSDAKGLLKSAIRSDNPVLFFEHRGLYEAVGDVPEEDYVVPLGVADVKRKGTDVTVIAISRMVPKALKAAEQAAAEGISVEVVDPRTLFPLDRETILESVRKTGRVVVAYEGYRTAGAGAELAALIAEAAIYDLEGPVLRVAGADMPLPAHMVTEQWLIPQAEDVLAAIRTSMG